MGLKSAGKRLLRDVEGDLELRPDERAVLLQACRVADTIDALDAALEGQPLTVRGSAGQLREHPLLSECRQQRQTLARLLRQLDIPDAVLDGAVDLDAARAAARSAHGRRAAGARWGT